MTRPQIALCLGVVFLPLASGADLKPETVAAFDRYTHATEARLEEQIRSGSEFLWCDASPSRVAAVRGGRILTRPYTPTATINVPDGLIHDWIGTVFVRGVTLRKALNLLQDYDHHKVLYGPEVMDSRILSRRGNDFRVYMRLLKKKVITVVLDTEHDAHWEQVGPGRWYSVSRSTRIQEVRNAGQSDEKRLPPGQGHGFLWRLNSYWKLQEREGGVYLECEAISLTRDIPTGLGWLISPIIRDLPKDSLEHTLEATRGALERSESAGGR